VQVVDASIVEGTALIINLFFGFKAAGEWTVRRETIYLMVALIFTAFMKHQIGKRWLLLQSNRKFRNYY